MQYNACQKIVKLIQLDGDGCALVMTDNGVTKLEHGATIVIPVALLVALLKGED